MGLESLRIAHLSDLHFAKPTWSPFQFFSKRWLGNLNLLFSRRPNFFQERLFNLPSLFSDLNIDLVVVTGDLSTTSRPQEFKEAAAFLNSFQEKGIDVLTLPGNHDHYTKAAFRKKLFYHYFPSRFDASFDLKEGGVALKDLKNGWKIILLDTALATPWISSQGLFSEEIEANLKAVLNQTSFSDHVMVANHFPLFHHQHPRKSLLRAEALRQLLREFPQVLLYLHGHTHLHTIADLRSDGLPLILDSGSTPYRHGSWNLIELNRLGASIDVFHWENKWKQQRHEAFKW